MLTLSSGKLIACLDLTRLLQSAFWLAAAAIPSSCPVTKLRSAISVLPLSDEMETCDSKRTARLALAHKRLATAKEREAKPSWLLVVGPAVDWEFWVMRLELEVGKRLELEVGGALRKESTALS